MNLKVFNKVMNKLLLTPRLELKMSSEAAIWAAIFNELRDAEEGLSKSINRVKEAVEASSTVKTGHKSDAWRNLHNQISKASKNIEKQYCGYNFDCDQEIYVQALNDSHWKEAIGEFLIREGWFPESDSFGTAVSKHRQAYAQLSSFLQNFEVNNEAIFEWIKSEFPDGQDKEDLMVEFIQYLFGQKLRSGDLTGALKILKSNSGALSSSKNRKIISKLLTKCLYMTAGQEGALTLISEPQLDSIKNKFVKSYCKISNIPKTDPLSVCNEIGTKAVPALDRLNSLIKSKNHSSLNNNDELPIELPVDEEYVYHSIFSCPVLKQQSSDINPPYLLTCGHALSKDALTKLSKGSTVARFKCPYCPNETNFSSCIQLTF